ncbi:polyprenyl synthetase family protein [Algoriphagus vanfongensis]|uniref:polyprenyl synthetase family protein n=1 Tax=Algoriphagus vanfongensis TaxID=426371 RepID=UPI0004129740|nr:polyprenyl synthetase family protein [Algoriphagus vanfongensis]
MTKESHAHALLDKLETYLRNQKFGENPQELYEPITYILSLGGKRVRPLLSLLAYGMYEKSPETILSQASAVEVFHNFTLMHDDIMDNAPLRRGKKTVHEQWNNNVAILSGDVMLVRAYDFLLPTTPTLLPKVLGLFNETAAGVCEGQQMDMNFETREEVHEDEYITMIRLKTAVLLGYALQMGGILAGAPEEDCQKLYDFGVNVGVGFQLKDDLLDVYADQAKFGKQVGGDIISNKKTYLLIKALELATGEDQKSLEYWVSQESFDKTEKVRAVKEIYENLGIRQMAENKMNQFFAIGLEQLDSIHYKNESYFQELRQLTEDLIHREK